MATLSNEDIMKTRKGGKRGGKQKGSRQQAQLLPAGRTAGGGKGLPVMGAARASATPYQMPQMMMMPQLMMQQQQQQQLLRQQQQQQLQQQQQQQQQPYYNRVYIANIPLNWSEQDVLTVMETVGPVLKLTLFTNTQGHMAGAGMVTYADSNGMNAAVRDLNGAKLGENVIRVSVARRKNQADQASGAQGLNLPQAGGQAAPAMGFVPQQLVQQQAMAMAQQMFAAQMAAVQQQQQQMLIGKGLKASPTKGGKGAKGAKQFAKPQQGKAKKSNAKIERQSLSKDDLDKQLTEFLQ